MRSNRHNYRYLYWTGGKSLIMNLLFVSYTPYWFVRTYLYLYLLSPMLNKYLRDISLIQRIFLISVLTYMAIWMGTIQCDGSLAGGKNVINFFLIYTIGNTLRTYQNKWKDVSIAKILSSYILLNILLVSLWMCFRNGIVGEGIMRISFWYCSPLLYVNAILLFMVFGRMKFTSKHINYCASSVFAIYLLHCQPYILNNIISKGAYAILNLTDAKELQTIVLFAVYATTIVVVSIMIDKLLTLFWKIVSDLTSKIEERTQLFFD